MAAPKKVDYEAIEPGWRAGLKSPTQLAFEYRVATGINVSRAAIIKHFKKLGVPRDLSAKVKAKAESMVAEAMVTGKVSASTSATDAAIINAAAEDAATVLWSHRTDIRRLRKLLAQQLAEAEMANNEPEVFAALRDMVAMPDETLPAAVEDMAKFISSLPQRVTLTKNVAETMKTVVALERTALGLNNEDGDGGKPTLIVKDFTGRGDPDALPVVSLED